MKFIGYTMLPILFAVLISKPLEGQLKYMEFEGERRKYDVNLPQDFKPNMPLVLGLHGFDVGINSFRNMTMLHTVTDTSGMITVYPEAPLPGWNAGSVIYSLDSFDTTRNDVGFISALIDTLKAHYDIDLSRVYACGHSGGGVMSYTLMDELSQRFAAIATVSSSFNINQYEDFNPQMKLPLMLANGTKDPWVTWDTKPTGNNGISVRETVDLLLKYKGCSNSSDTIALPDIDVSDGSTVEKITFNDCLNEGSLLLYRVLGGDHPWPGARTWIKQNKDIDASVEVIKFFKEHWNPYVYIPDMAFLYALIDEGVDTNGDSLISYSEAEATFSLTIRFDFDEEKQDTVDVKGIGAFKNLDSLVIYSFNIKNLELNNLSTLRTFSLFGGNLETIDLSGNTMLEDLQIIDSWGHLESKLKHLDVSHNTALKSLMCQNNELTTINLSKNTLLKQLRCSNNRLEHLNLSNNTMLESLYCAENELVCLDISKNPALKVLYVSRMPTLFEVCVGETPFPPEGVEIDTSNCPNIYFSDECLNQIVYIPDTAFLYALIDEGVDANGDSLISYDEADVITILSIEWPRDNRDTDTLISQIKGIEAFIKLKSFVIEGTIISSMDLSQNVSLEALFCGHNSLKMIDLALNTNLRELDCGSNPLTELDLSNNPLLIDLGCAHLDLTTIDLSNNTELENFECGGYNNRLQTLDLTNNKSLISLDIFGGQLNTLDLSENKFLTDLYIIYASQLSTIDLSGNKELKDITIFNSKLNSINLSENIELVSLSITDSKLSSLDLQNNTKLKLLRCAGNHLNTLDVTNCKDLEQLNFGHSIHGLVNYGIKQNFLRSIDLSENLNLQSLNCSGNLITELDISKNILLEYLQCGSNFLTHLDLSQNRNIRSLYCKRMESLYEICVWETFDPDLVNLDTSDSPNVTFTKNCSDFEAPSIVADDSLYQAGIIEATSSEDGMIYLVPEDTDKELETIRGLSIDSITARYNIPVSISLSGLENGVYWLYARDSTGNISEPEAFTIMGVGIESGKFEDIRIYPNPVNTRLTIESSMSELIYLEITSLNGQLLYKGEMEGTTHKLDLSTFHNGVYFITIRSKDFITTRKILKLP